MFRVPRVESHSDPRMISGIVETGQYGYEADLYDVAAESISHTRTSVEAEMVPFFFLAYLPARRNEGVLILQRRSQYGIRTVFLKDFARHLQEEFPNIRVEFNPLVTQNLIDRFIEDGRINKVRFIRFDLRSDITDYFVSDGHTESPGQAEVTISARRNGALNLLGRVSEVLSGTRPVDKMVELRELVPGLDFSYNTVKVELELGGNRRTLDLSKPMKLRAYYDISSEVEVGTNGHPQFDSIEGLALDLMDDLLEELGMRNVSAR